MMISYLVTYFLEVGARFSLKVTTKPLLRENPKSLILGYFSKVKKEYCDQKKKKKKVYLIILECLCLVSMHIFWK